MCVCVCVSVFMYTVAVFQLARVCDIRQITFYSMPGSAYEPGVLLLI